MSSETINFPTQLSRPLALFLFLFDFFCLPLLLGSWFIRLPLQIFTRDFFLLGPLALALQVIINNILLLENDVLAAPVLDHAQVLEGGHDVVGLDAHLLADGLEADLPVRVGAQVLQDDVLPVGAVRDEAQVRQRLLRAADLALHPRQQVGEVNQETAIALQIFLVISM